MLQLVWAPRWAMDMKGHHICAVPVSCFTRLLHGTSAIEGNLCEVQVSEVQHVPEHGVSVIFVTLPNTKLELLHPLGDDSPIAKFLQKNPSGGLHHICLEVADIQVTATVDSRCTYVPQLIRDRTDSISPPPPPKKKVLRMPANFKARA